MALITPITHGNQASHESESKVAATVNGVPILTTEKEKSVQLTEFVLGGADFQKIREEIETSVLQVEIDRRLLRQEFERKGGMVKPEYVDRLVKNLIERRFEGKEKGFRDQLTKSGISEEELRVRLIDDLILQVFRNDQSLNKGDFESFMESLRDEANVQTLG